MAVCLNLPYEMWHLPEMAFFVGITPPPKEPTVTTMTSLLEPCMEQFQEMWEGKKVPTYDHPEGDVYRVAILAAIGDLLALKKALGAAGCGSHNFCSYCKVKRKDIDRLDLENFEPRVGSEARTAAVDDASSSDSDTEKGDVEMMDVEDDVQAELEELFEDSRVKNDGPTALSRHTSLFFIDEVEDKESGEGGADDSEDEEEEEDEDAIYESEKPSQVVFDDEGMAFIHAGLAAVVIPSWMERPPVNLGEKSHGKLKADNWLILFTIFFPLLIPELWWGTGDRRDGKLLRNLHDLIGATNILCSYVASPERADQYTEMYLRYLRTSQSLFPGLTTRPNHHYAMHNGDQMKWWGELDLTMLRQICRRGRLLATIKDTAKSASESLVVKAMQALSPRVRTVSSVVERSAPGEETIFNGSGPVMDNATYELIFRYWNRTYSPPYIRAANLRIDQADRKHDGNSSISFRHPFTGRKELGFIQSAWAQILQGEKRTFLVVQPHTFLTPTDSEKTPYHTHPQFTCTVGYTAPSRPQAQVLIEPKHIIFHVPYVQRPKGTYEIRHEITLFVDAAQRGRE
ncbi:hypothetical protein C8R46DRAFT_1023851 [Mycena filopes]|nr:hypothetical protein C8R46DRAFT_1023851 [Mycena filopes]